MWFWHNGKWWNLDSAISVELERDRYAEITWSNKSVIVQASEKDQNSYQVLKTIDHWIANHRGYH